MSDEMTVRVPAEWSGTPASLSAYLAGFAAGVASAEAAARARNDSEDWDHNYRVFRIK